MTLVFDKRATGNPRDFGTVTQLSIAHGLIAVYKLISPVGWQAAARSGLQTRYFNVCALTGLSRSVGVLKKRKI